jgi:excisionase family DNA binding protein
MEAMEQRKSQTMDFAQVILMLSSVGKPKGDPPGVHPKAEFISSNVAAEWLGLPLRSFHQYVQAGLLPSYKIGRHRLFRRSELLDALGASRKATWDEFLR